MRDDLACGPMGLVLAVSGGIDSMVLLHALARLAAKARWTLHATHCHHGLRGSEADLDAALVEKACSKLGVPLVSGRIEVRGSARTSGESLEMTARRLRHRFFAETAHSLGIHHVLLAHHADDQAEWFLLKLLRGAGSDGFAGMRACGVSPSDPRLLLLRPFLCFTRAEIVAFARKHQVPFREDISNKDPGIPRNRVRYRLLPYLKKNYTPALPRILNRISEIAAAESDFLRDEAIKWRRRNGARPYSALPLALQRTVLRQELWELGQDVDFETLERIRLRRMTLPIIQAAERAPRSTTLRSRTKSQKPVHLQIDHDGSIVLPEGLLSWEIRSSPLPFDSGTEQLDADTLGPKVTLRTRQAGDIFRSLGMSQAARLQNIFINQKVPVLERSKRWILATLQGSIAWVEGLPPGDEFKITPATRRILVLRRAKNSS